MILAKELRKPEYTGLSNEDALQALHSVTVNEGVLIPATTVNQQFAKLDLTGVIDDIASTQGHPYRHKMSSVNKSILGNHPFNFIEGTLAGDGNITMLNMMIDNIPEISAQMAEFKALMLLLSNKKSHPFTNVTLDDVVTARAVQFDDVWHELEETAGQSFQLQLNIRPPEVTYVTVQWQGVDGEWYHATALHGLYAPITYRAPIPFYGNSRKIRWKCEYLLDGTVTVV